MEIFAENTRARNGAVLVAVVLGALLRWYFVQHGLWRDEASTYFDSAGGSFTDVLRRVSISELNPPGYFLFMHAWLWCAPASDIFLKMPSLLASLALVPLAAAIGSYLGGARIAIAAAWVTALAPMDLYYAQEARPYMFEAVFVLLSVWGMCMWLERPQSLGASLLFAVGLLGAACMQYTGLLFAATMLLLWIGYRVYGDFRAPLAPIALVGCGLAAIVIACYPSALAQAQSGLSWSDHIGWRAWPEVGARDLLVTLPLDWFPHHELAKAILVALIALEAVVMLVERRTLTVPGGKFSLVLALAAIGIAICEIPISNHGRYMVPFSPLAWLVLVAWIGHGFSGEKRRAAVGVCALIVFFAMLDIGDLKRIVADRGEPKSGAQLLDRSMVGDASTLVVAPDFLAPTVAYYMRRTPLHIVGFARFEQPYYFSPLGYARLWQDPNVVHAAIGRIASLRISQSRPLLVITALSEDSGTVPYSKTAIFMEHLHRSYRVRRSYRLNGSIESMTLEQLVPR